MDCSAVLSRYCSIKYKMHIFSNCSKQLLMHNIKDEVDMFFCFLKSAAKVQKNPHKSLTSRGLPYFLNQHDIVYIRCHCESIPRKNISHNKTFVMCIICAYSKVVLPQEHTLIKAASSIERVLAPLRLLRRAAVMLQNSNGLCFICNFFFSMLRLSKFGGQS